MNQQTLKRNKTALYQFMEGNRKDGSLIYSTEKLCALLAHARDGKLAYISCCCAIGVATADHALRGEEDPDGNVQVNEHYRIAKSLPLAYEAERAYDNLKSPTPEHLLFPDDCTYTGCRDALRRRRLIPLIRVVLRRRELAAAAVEEQEMVTVA